MESLDTNPCAVLVKVTVLPDLVYVHDWNQSSNWYATSLVLNVPAVPPNFNLV